MEGQVRFRKKPVVIDAWPAAALIEASRNRWSDLPEPIVSAYEAGNIVFTEATVSIYTLEGTMIANHSDYVIRGVSGELYPCKPDIFAATYEPVDEDDDRLQQVL